MTRHGAAHRAPLHSHPTFWVAVIIATQIQTQKHTNTDRKYNRNAHFQSHHAQSSDQKQLNSWYKDTMFNHFRQNGNNWQKHYDHSGLHAIALYYGISWPRPQDITSSKFCKLLTFLNHHWCKRTDHGAKQSPLIISASMFGKSSAETRQHPPMSKAPSFTLDIDATT